MQRLIEELECAEFQGAHPVIQSSYAHYALVVIHPFADGNGRLARAVASAYTYKDASIPLMVLDEHRVDYLSALAAADAGDADPFVEIIERVTREALDLVRDSLQTAMAPQPEALLEEFTGLYAEEAKRQRQDQVVRDFVDWLMPEVEKQVADLDSPAGVQIGIETFGDTKRPPPNGFRNLDADGTRSFRINLESAPPASAKLPRRLYIFIDGDAENGAVLLRGVQMPDEQLRLARSDLEPTISSLAQRRVENFLSRVLGDGLNELLQKARQQVGR